MHRVDGLVPARFAAFARVLHPFRDVGGEPTVTWQQVADWSGRALHRLAQAPPIAIPIDGRNSPRPFEDDQPLDGLPSREVRNLLPHLSAATESTDACYFGVWDGYGHFHSGSSSTFTLGTSADSKLSRLIANLRNVAERALYEAPGETRVDAVPPLVQLDETFTVPGRDFFMFSGPLSIAPDLKAHVLGIDGEDLSGTEAPNVWWPASEAWMVSTDIDLASTYIGGSEALINSILADPTLEAFRAHSADDVSLDADIINT